MGEITIEEGEDMDLLLQRIVALQEKRKDATVDIMYLYFKFLKEKGEYYVTDIVYKMLDHIPKILVAEEKSGLKTTVWPTPLLEDFLVKGGFTKIAKELSEIKQRKAEMEKLNLEKGYLANKLHNFYGTLVLKN